MNREMRAEIAGGVDRELALLAQAGEISALEQLLARHRPAMMAVGLGMLGGFTEAEDAVQDAMLVALSRIGDLRDPGAVGPWLKAIVRNCCRMQLRARTPVPVADMTALPLHRESDVEEALDRHAARDWVWHAVERLSPPLRLVTILRYFSEASTYEEIAAVCGVPVGTVRSRLSKARAKLCRELLVASSAPHDDAQALTEARRQEASAAQSAAERGHFGDFLRETWCADVETVWADGARTRGVAPVRQAVDSSMEAGVRQRLANLVASREIVIWEIDVLNPEVEPHCPSRPSWLLFLEGGRVRRFRHFVGGSATT